MTAEKGKNHLLVSFSARVQNKAYVEYVMQDFRQPMGVATYKTSDEMDAKLLEVLPSKEQLEKLLGDYRF